MPGGSRGFAARYREPGEDPELYDLKQDPFELQNIVSYPAYSSLRATLAARLHRLEHCAGRSCRDGSSEPRPRG